MTREIIKQIYIRESLQPPNLSTIRSAYSSLWSQINTPGLMRNLFKSGEVGRIGVYGLQAYGLFKVRFVSFFFFFWWYSIKVLPPFFFGIFQIGEILGRRSLVGYDLH